MRTRSEYKQVAEHKRTEGIHTQDPGLEGPKRLRLATAWCWPKGDLVWMEEIQQEAAIRKLKIFSNDGLGHESSACYMQAS